MLVPLCLACIAMSAAALPADFYRSNSRLGEGKWVKVSVSEEGMQLLTNEQLKNMGFSDPSKVRVFGYGGRRLPESLSYDMADDLPEQPVLHTSAGVLFFGTGTISWEIRNSQLVHRQNNYGTTSCYFVTDSEAEPTEWKTQDVAFGADDEVLVSVPCTLLHELESFSTGPTGGDLFGEDFRSTTSRFFTFDMPDAASDEVSYLVRFGAKSSVSTIVSASGDGAEFSSANIASATSVDTYLKLVSLKTNGTIADGQSTVNVKYEGGGVLSAARLDYIHATYEKLLRLRDGQLHFYYTALSGENVVFAVDGCSESTVIWDVTNPAAPQTVKFKLDGGEARFAPSAVGLNEYIVFNPDVVAANPSTAGAVASQDIHGMEVPDMVIITPKDYESQAERIAQMHREKDGMIVHVLTPEVIYNEFSSGSPEVTGYRRMLKMWYDRGQANPSGTQLQHCLLFGRATYDQRMLTDALKSSSYPRLLSWQNDLLTQNSNEHQELYSLLSDNYIAMLDDVASFNMAKGKLNIGVGRMPVKSLSEARTMADKLINFVENPGQGGWRNNVMMIADDGDYGVHLEQNEKSYKGYIANGNGSSFLYTRLYLDAFPLGTGGTTKSFPALREKMFRLLDEGVTLWQYVGHSNTTSWTGENIWTYSDLTSMTNRNLPLLYSASCEFIRFDSDAISGCELMWLHPSSGIIAAVAANRKVLISENEAVSVGLGTYFFRRDEEGKPRRLGDIYKDAINYASTQNNNNRHMYAVMGDPAMRVLSTAADVVVDEVDGVAVNDIADAADYPVVKGSSRMVLKGSIKDADNQIISDFNGTIVATLYDAETVVTTYGRAVDGKDGKVVNYNDRTNRLFSGNFKVTGGKWEATLLLPEDIENIYTQARVTLYAYKEDGSLSANGECDRFYIYGWDDEGIADDRDPEILAMYLNSPAFKSGSKVTPSPVFYATMYDESGINISSTGVGRQMTIVVDDRNVYSNVSDYFSTDPEDVYTGHVAYPLGELNPGRHKLDFTVYDNAGNSTRQGFEFEIADLSSIPEVDLYTNANPAVTSVTFYVTAPETTGGLIEVFDLSGRRVWSSNGVSGAGLMTTTWDLLDAGGNRVPRGIYIYRATVTGSDGKEKRASKKLAVGNP